MGTAAKRKGENKSPETMDWIKRKLLNRAKSDLAKTLIKNTLDKPNKTLEATPLKTRFLRFFHIDTGPFNSRIIVQ